MARFPLLPFTIPFILGIFLCYCLGWTGWIVLPSVIAAVVAYRFRRRMVALMLLGLVTGYSIAMLRAPGEMSESLVGSPHLYSGFVKTEKEQGSMKVMVVRIDSCDRVSLSPFLVKCIIPTLGIGGEECDRITFSGTLRHLSHETDLPDEIDYNASLALQGVRGECYIIPDSVKSLLPESGVLNDLRRFRVDVAALLSQGTLSSEATDFLIATLTGERDILLPAHHELFSRAGLSHLLALSGLHVGIIALVLSIILFPLALIGYHRTAAVITVIVMWGFAVMTGLTPSVVRSVIMCSVFLITYIVQREWTPVNALCIAALIILFFSPQSLFSIGFQMSFIAVLSIIVFAPALNPLKKPGTPGRWVVMLITVPIAAMLGTGIISAFHFHTFPLLFLISNVVASLALPMLLGMGIVKVLLGFMGWQTGFPDKMIDFLYGIIDGVARMADSFTWGTASGIYVSLATVIVWFVALTFFALWLYRRRRVWLVATGMTLLFCLCLPFLQSRTYPSEELYITRSHTETTMLIRSGDQLLAYTTAHPSQTDVKLARDLKKYSLYMLKRGLKSIELLTDGYSSETVIRQGNIVTFGSRRFQFVTSGDNPKADRLDFAVICRGFRGDIVELAQDLGADTVLLSSDLDLRSHDRYARELSEASIPYLSLRSAPMVLR